MKKLIAAVALGSALLGTAAIAQDGPKPRFDPMAKVDANKDGVVTKAEMLASVAERFGKVDTNKDGKISPEERKASREKMRERMEKHRGMRGDVNGDGVLTRAEALAQFDKADKNHDGQLTADERPGPKMHGRMGKRGHHGKRGMRAMRGGHGDQVITLAEEQARATRRFDIVDANHDGKIDQAERAAMRDKMMAKRDHGRFGGRQGPPPADAPDAPDGE